MGMNVHECDFFSVRLLQDAPVGAGFTETKKTKMEVGLKIWALKSILNS